MCTADTSNQNKEKKSEDIFKSCSVDINDYVFAHHCFMTGEYCSKQLNVQREREKLHRKGEINAFVIMSFTDMTDVVYKWRLQSYIESLTEFLFFKSGEKKTEAEMMREFYKKSSTQQEDEAPWHSLEETKRKENYKLYINYLNEKKDEEEEKKADHEEYHEMSSLCCYSSDEAHRKVFYDELEKGTYHPELKVKKINVIRADSNPSSNFVICNRVCQQMQIADLIVVDVSDENTNVFYELGMAVALGKMILPICYSESYFTMKIPLKVEEEKQEYLKRLCKRESDCLTVEDEEKIKNTPYDNYVLSLERHIDCYPWQRQLFEHFGLRYRGIYRNDATIKAKKDDQDKDKETSWYFAFGRATDKRFSFSDQKYDRFPYLDTHAEKGYKIGEELYSKLQDSFNTSGKEDNTLVLYNMDMFLNKADGGRCIVNYHRAIVERLNKESCFCGDRVGILVQPTSIAEAVKDADERRHLLYNVGEIVQIGMNQATYEAHRELIKPAGFLSDLTGKYSGKTIATNTDGEIADSANIQNELYVAERKDWAREVSRFTKNHIRNRSFAIYPHDPVYVSRVVKNGVQCDLLENNCDNQDQKLFFCLYHIMLQNLKYVNEVVVDISTNSVQSLFWLGAAHGSGVNAISIRHDMSQNEEKNLLEAAAERELCIPVQRPRNIFDISGLWTAVLHSFDTERFYRQLALAQLGIEQRTKLMLRDVNNFDAEVISLFWETEEATQKNIDKKSINAMYEEKKKQEEMLMESYYRSHFWRPMLRRNRLQIYSCTTDSKLEDGEPRSFVAAWDVDAISAFSYYLSKRKLIGEYQIKAMRAADQRTISERKSTDQSALELNKKNYICIGAEASPFTGKKIIPKYLNETLELTTTIYQRFVKKRGSPNASNGADSQSHVNECKIDKGFENGEKNVLFTQNVLEACRACPEKSGKMQKVSICQYKNGIDLSINGADSRDLNEVCDFEGSGKHYQVAQLLLWRDDVSGVEDIIDYAFRASLAGASGPATYALSTLFVDEDQKTDAFGKMFSDEDGKPTNKINEKRYPLLLLQTEVRKIMLERYQQHLESKLRAMLHEKIDKEIEQEPNEEEKPKKEEDPEKEEQRRTHYIKRVTCVTKAYLSTELYRYFFPFLSRADEVRICNGLQLYIRSMMAGKLSPFNLQYEVDNNLTFTSIMSKKVVNASADIAVSVLKDTLSEFRALEVFYKVEVDLGEKAGTAPIDTRRIHSITLLKKTDNEGSDRKSEMNEGNCSESMEYFIRCVFADKKPRKTVSTQTSELVCTT